MTSKGLPLQRLGFGDLSDEAAALLRSRFDRLGYLGDVFAVLSNNDTAVRSFVTFADGSGSAVTAIDREIAALSISAASGAKSEQFPHEHRALAIGMAPKTVAAIVSLDPTHPELEPAAAQIIRLSVAAIGKDWGEATDVLATIARDRGDDVAAGLLLQIGYYMMATTVGHVLQLESPVPSIFESE